MSRASKILNHQYDPIRVKALIDEEIDSNMAKGKWEFPIEDLLGHFEDIERANHCIAVVQVKLESEGFFVQHENKQVGYGSHVVVMAECPKTETKGK